MCILALLVATFLLDHGMSGSSTNWDVSSQWYSDIAAKGPEGCRYPPRPQDMPHTYPKCKPFPPGVDGKAAYQRVRAQGWRVAPKMYMHPLETSYLADMESWTKSATFFNPLTAGPMNYSAVAAAIRAAPTELQLLGAGFTASHLFKLVNGSVTNPQLDLLTMGDTIEGAMMEDRAARTRMPFSGRPQDRKRGEALYGGYSRTRQYYTANNPYNSSLSEGGPELDPELADTYAAIVFRFSYFYPWNGCSNQLLALAVSGQYQASEYLMCPVGVHEGDVERINVWVCVSEWDDADPSSAIKVAQYASHGWLDQYDCTKGQCSFETDERGARRLRAFSSLSSHASYPQASPLYVYYKVDGFFILNIDGLYIGDRTSDQGPVFLPDANNTLWLPTASEMTPEQREQFEWALYPGSLGGWYMAASTSSLTCLFNNLTSEGPCNTTNPANWYLDFFLGKRAIGLTNNVDDIVWNCTIPQGQPIIPQGLTGPLFRGYTYTPWDIPKAAPCWDKDPYANFTCPMSGDPTDTHTTWGVNPISLSSFLGTITGLLVGAGVVFAVALHWPRLHSVIAPKKAAGRRKMRFWVWDKVQGASGLEEQPESDVLLPLDSSTTQEYYALRHTLWMCIGVALYIAGIVMAGLGLDAVFAAIRQVVQLELFEQIRRAIVAVLVLFGAWQLILILLTLLFRSQRTISFPCCSLTNPLARWRGVARAGWRFHTLVAGLLVIEINTTMLLFTFGVIMWLARYVMQNVCASVVERLFGLADEVALLCVDLSLVGIDKQMCGADLANLCSLWSGLHIDLLVWGSLCFILSHLLFLVMCAHQYSQLQTLQALRDAEERVAAMAELGGKGEQAGKQGAKCEVEMAAGGGGGKGGDAEAGYAPPQPASMSPAAAPYVVRD